MAPPIEIEMRRRTLLVGSAAAAAACGAPWAADAQTQPPAEPAGPETSQVRLTVNGRQVELEVDNRTTLLDALRENLQLTGAKKGCDHGQCGACTAMVDGQRINACLSLAVMHDGAEITTIEGMGAPDDLSPMQAAFVENDGFQCGYCTPGQICSAVATLEEIKAGIPSHVTDDLTAKIEATEAEIRERMSGNICRCGAYSNILAAITQVAEEQA